MAVLWLFYCDCLFVVGLHDFCVWVEWWLFSLGLVDCLSDGGFAFELVVWLYNLGLDCLLGFRDCGCGLIWLVVSSVGA